MRILQLSKLQGGGATHYARTLDAGLRECGVDSRLLNDCDIPETASIAARSVSHFINRAVSRLYVEVQRGVFHRTNRWREFNLRPLLAECDLVHIHQATDWMGLNHLFADIPKTTPIVMSLHDLWPITGGCVIYGGCHQYRETCRDCPVLSKPFNRFLGTRQLEAKVKLYARERLSFIANSEWTRDMMREATVLAQNHSISVIHPAVDANCYAPRDRAIARSKLNIPDDALVLCTGAASVTDCNKNIAAVLRVAANVRSDRRIVTIVFGDGVLSVPAGMNVRFLGAITDQSELARIYNASDMFVSTSRMETYGMTFIEAMACGIPVLAYRTGAIPSVLNDGNAGRLIELDNESALVSAINDLAADRAHAQQLGEAGRNLVVRRNGVKPMVDAHISHYKSVLGVRA